MSKLNILSYLGKIYSGKLERAELRKFIEISHNIALIYLEKKHFKYKSYFTNNGKLFNDIAIDAITPLYIRKNSLDLNLIKKAMSKWDKDITSEEDAAFFLYNLIWKRVDQTIVSILHELDPLYGSILNSIMYYIKNNDYKKIYYFGHSYIVEADNDIIKGTIIAESEFNNIPAKLINNKINTAIKNVFDYLKNSTEHFPAIPLNYFVIRIKQLYLNDNNSDGIIEDNHDSRLFVDHIISDSLRRVNAIIDNRYVTKKKISIDEGEIFKKVLENIAIDLKGGSMSSGVDDYLKPYFNNLTNNDIKIKYHNILDYLIRLVKKYLAGALKYKRFS